MSIHTVQIVPAEEQYAPPTQIIEFAVVGDTTDQLVRETTEDGETTGRLQFARKLVLLSLSEYEETNEGSTAKRKIDFPPIDLNDLVRALNTFGVQGGALHFGEVPFRLQEAPAVPEEPAK